MKISEHLDLTLKTENLLHNLQSDNLSKILVDHLFDYSKSLNGIEFSELFEHERPSLIYKEYKNSLQRLKSVIHFNKQILEFDEISNLIKKESAKERIEYEYHYKQLQEVSSEEREQNSVLESACYKYDSNSIEFERIESDYDEINKKYKIERNISASLYEKWESKKRDLFYLLKINPIQIIKQIDEVEKQLLKLNIIEKYSEKLLKDESLIYFIYRIFVELKLIKHISFVQFTDQLIGSELMSYEKEPKKDRNIAYAINCIANEFILPEIAPKWKKNMADYFELKDFEKKINPSEDNKNATDKEIDTIISQAKMSSF